MLIWDFNTMAKYATPLLFYNIFFYEFFCYLTDSLLMCVIYKNKNYDIRLIIIFNEINVCRFPSVKIIINIIV